MTAYATPRVARPLRTIWTVLALTALTTVATSPLSATAQAPDTWPVTRIRFLVPFAAGGGGDITTRQVGKAIEPILGQPIFIENKPGANGRLGTELGARAAPDGYTVLMGSIGTHVINQYLYPKLPYDPAKDFIPVTLMTKTNNVVVVPAESPIKSVQDLVQMAKQKPGTLTSGIPAIGDTAHLGFEKMRRDAGIEVVGVPYNSVGGAVTDLIGGRLQYMFASIVSQNPHIQGGKLRALATTDATRSPVLPNVPTLGESGFPGFVATGWLGLFVPAGTPQEIVEKLSAAVRKAYQSPEVLQTMRAGGDPIASTPKEFADLIAAERAKWSKVIREANIKLE